MMRDSPERSGGARIHEVIAISRQAPLRVLVQDALIELISSRAFPPGTHLVETELAERFGVSRLPVREALQYLESDGWIELRQGRGAFVREPSAKEVSDVFEVRIRLEAASAELAAARGDLAPLDELRSVAREGFEAFDVADDQRLVTLNAQFHNGIAGMAGNDTLTALIASMERKVRWYFSTVALDRGRVAWDDHVALLDAIAARDVDTAGTIMRLHVQRSLDRYNERMSQLA